MRDPVSKLDLGANGDPLRTKAGKCAGVRGREIAHAFRMAPDRFSNERVGDVPARPPQSMAFLRLGLYMINRVVY